MNNGTQDAHFLGLISAFIEGNKEAPYRKYEPRFLKNDKSNGIKVLTTIEEKLNSCKDPEKDKFFISVAFITKTGIAPLLMTLDELEKRGIKGQILTTDYQSFTEPAALRRLAEFTNIEIKLYCCGNNQNLGFHTKGYIFENADLWHIILGSSNWTSAALTTNQEWNTLLVSNREGRLAQEVIEEFNKLWNASNSYRLNDYIDFYEEQWVNTKKIKAIDFYEENWLKAKEIREQASSISKTLPFKPNSMQEEFVSNVCEMINQKKDRALLISATGTGKTFAAAFAVQKIDPNPKRVLFIVHRGQIAKQAKSSFEGVLQNQFKSYGLLSGDESDFDADCLFATTQTISKDDVLNKYKKKAFDLIIIDEAHHATAASYKKIINYFQPKFWIGMTATPDRPDTFNVFELFNYNIAYEIRLETALAEGMLCPFHYFGITDIEVNGEAIKDTSNFNALTCDQRVKHIIEKAEYFGFSGDRVKGLVFCSTISECRELSRKFNGSKCRTLGRNYRTLVLSGGNKQEEREKEIARLVQNNKDGNELDYIFTVDIFNEGVDIPEVNQIILLRPTQSPIVFVQQLGRGLRKAKDKNFLIVLDFIGNYRNNFLIPVALSGDKSYDKDNLRRFVSVGSHLIRGQSTIHFDEITRKRIYQAIKSASTQTVKLINDAYTVLKYRLGRRPKLIEFEENDSIDVIKIFNKFGSYYNFLKEKEPNFKGRMSPAAEEILCFCSKQLGKAQRISETLILEALLSGASQNSLKQYLKDELSNKYNKNVSKDHLSNVEKVLTNNFAITQVIKKSRKNCVFIEATENDEWKINSHFNQVIQENPVFREFLEDLIEFMKRRFKSRYKNSYKNTDLVLNEKYSYEDVCRLLNWDNNVNGLNIGGYKYDEKTKTLPVFINYVKSANAKQYNDKFQSPQTLVAYSKSKRKLESPDADHIYKRTLADENNHIYLFIRREEKDKNEPEYFYFLGEIEATGSPELDELPTGETLFKIIYKLSTPVRQDIYDYITE